MKIFIKIDVILFNENWEFSEYADFINYSFRVFLAQHSTENYRNDIIRAQCVNCQYLSS